MCGIRSLTGNLPASFSNNLSGLGAEPMLLLLKPGRGLPSQSALKPH